MLDHATAYQYQAELEALYQACKYMEKQHNLLKPKCVQILTDSWVAL